MIISFNSKSTEDLFHGVDSKDARKIPQTIWEVATRKLDMLNAASMLVDLKAPPANRLEALKGTLRGKYSIRINDRYRIVFAFKDGNAHEVEVTDYH
ncbi:MAG: plasmid maintenance system killer protein [Omnitrophica bacterium RIFCSPLOWO2_12_FULL_50_11]|nr:MAG: plasmid maintenance system killer protein [Omnitrophica bacterium RIFCSPLOWO2_12_FULL_50_11]